MLLELRDSLRHKVSDLLFKASTVQFQIVIDLFLSALFNKAVGQTDIQHWF